MLTAVVLTGCLALQPVASKEERISLPPLNTEAKAELGDTVVNKGRIFTVDKVILRNETGCVWGKLEPGTYTAQAQDAQFVYYMKSSARNQGSIGISKKNPSDVRVCHFTEVSTYRLIGKPPPLIDVGKERVFASDTFQQELIYNGRAGDILKFLYREFSGDALRFPFSQEVQYDLKEGKVVGFKGARIEVLSASNTQLVYRLTSNFPDR